MSLFAVTLISLQNWTVPVDEIALFHLTLNGTFEHVINGGTLHMRRLHYRTRSGIKCIVKAKGSSIEPDIRVYMGDVDITHRFDKAVDRIWLEVGGRWGFCI